MGGARLVEADDLPPLCAFPISAVFCSVPRRKNEPFSKHRREWKSAENEKYLAARSPFLCLHSFANFPARLLRARAPRV